MNTHTRQKLSIVEVPRARKSSVKRNLRATESKSVQKRTAKKQELPGVKSGVKSRTAKPGSSSQKSLRRQTLPQQPTVETAIEQVPPIEMDLPVCVPAELEPLPSLFVDETPPILAPLAEASAAEESTVATGFAMENSPDPAVELWLPEAASPETAAIAEPELTPATEMLTPIEEAIACDQIAEPARIRRTFAFQWNAFLHVLTRGWTWLQQRLKTQQSKKRLRVCESVSLGEKRFIAVVQVDGEQFLVGGSSSSVSTLAHLEHPREFADVFRRYGQNGMQA